MSRAWRVPVIAFGRCWSGIGLLLCLWITAGASQAASQQIVTVAALPERPGIYDVSVAFPTLVSRTRGEAEIVDLWKRSGWAPTSVVWANSPAYKRFPAQTTVDFTVTTLYPKDQFPVEAIALAFRNWGGADITFSHDGTFHYGGKPHYENADATMDVSVAPNACNVSVRIRNPRIESLSFTELRSGNATGSAHARRGLPLWAIIMLALPVAALVGLLVYAVLTGRVKPEAGQDSRG